MQTKPSNLAIQITGLRKTYSNGFTALSGIDLEIPRGSFYALLGPNGAGKSTTIGIITGLIRLTAGTVLVGGVDTADNPVGAKSKLGVVAQEINFGIFETLLDIVVGQAGYYGIPRSKAIPIAEKNLRALGLWEKRNQQARTLSGGMKRRLMIARALVHEPEILILDEPTAGVDLELRRGMWDFLRDLNSKWMTIVLTTHYLEEAEMLCDRVAIIRQGEIVKEGEMKALLSGLNEETYIVETKETPTEETLESFKDLTPIIHDGTIEIVLRDVTSLDEVIGKFHTAGLTVHRVRNKTNRLEELFLNLTK